jgi:hypothetical protein
MRPRQLVVIALVLLAVLGVLAVAKLTALVAQDKCLDSGGAWQNGSCARQGLPPTHSGHSRA